MQSFFRWLCRAALVGGLPFPAVTHWDDVFDDHGCVQNVVHHYDDGGPNDLEGRNTHRRAAHLETDRLAVVPMTPLHREGLTCFLDPQTMTLYEGGDPWDKDYLQKRMTNWVNRWDISAFSWWSIFQKTDESCIGAVGTYQKSSEPVVEIAYLLGSPYYRQGFMSEAFSVVIPYCEKRLPEGYMLGAPVSPDNKASLALLTKFGFKKDETKSHKNNAGQPRDFYRTDGLSVP
jgi:RimJ/RimL family protein N-acetyltransferase